MWLTLFTWVGVILKFILGLKENSEKKNAMAASDAERKVEGMSDADIIASVHNKYDRD